MNRRAELASRASSNLTCLARTPDMATMVTSPTSTVDTAKSEAANVKDTAAGAASDVAQTAKSEASNVAQEAKYQARNLMDQTRSEVRGQVNSQQSALAGKLNGWASELGSMASKSDESGTMTDLAQEASRRVGEISHWLDNHEPRDVLEEVKRFARRQPVAFLAIAAAAGVVAGRLTRGAVAANTSVDSGREPTPARAYDSDLDRGDYEGAGYGDRTYQDGGYTPRYGESVPTGAPYRGRRHNCCRAVWRDWHRLSERNACWGRGLLSAAGRR